MKKFLLSTIITFNISIASAASISASLPNMIVGPLMKESAMSILPSNITGTSSLPSSPVTIPVGSSIYGLFAFLTNAGTVVTSLIPSIP